MKWTQPIPPIGPYTNVSVRLVVFGFPLGSFRNYMKLDAKQGHLVQLMRKFLPRSQVGIFLYERTQSTPLDPKLMFWCVA